MAFSHLNAAIKVEVAMDASESSRGALINRKSIFKIFELKTFRGGPSKIYHLIHE